MTTIDKLLLRGVRAFDPEHPEVISFGVPLTLIVGHNGAGKTTIIEALKYGSAGILPPGSKGNEVSYLHDPSLCGEKETSAQIKIVMHTSNGAKVTGTRNMAIQQKRGKLSFTAATQSIQLDRVAEKNVQSMPKGQMDAQMTKWLGVSSAVLDRVIFCHQDESLWPMSTAREVKLYFDELFEIKKYADAIAQLRTLKKTQKAKLEGHQKDAYHEKVNKDRGKTLERDCRRLNDEIADLKQEVNDLGAQMREATSKSQAAHDSASRAGEIVGTLAGKRFVAQAKEQLVEDLNRDLQKLNEDDAVLEDTLSRYEQLAEEDKRGAQAAEEHASSLQEQIKESRKILDNELGQVGSLKGQQDTYDKQVDSRKTLVKHIAHRHQFRDFNIEIDDDQLKIFMQRMARLASEQNAAMDNAKREAKVELQDIQKSVNSVNTKRATLNTRKENAKQILKDNDSKIDQYQRDYDLIDVDEGGMFTLQVKLENLQADLDTTRASTKQADLLTMEKRTELELSAVYMTKQALEEELKKATESVGDNAQLEFVQNDMRERQQRLGTIIGAHKSKISSTLGEWEPSSVKSMFDGKVAEASAAFTESQKLREDSTRALENVDSQLEKCRANIKAHETSIKTAAAAIDNVIDAGPQGYHEEVAELEKIRADIKTDADSCEIMLKWFEQCIRDAERSHVCRTCTRALVKDKDIEVMKRNMNSQRERYDVQVIANNLADADNDLAQAKAVGPQVELWERLSKVELPALKTDVRQLEQQRDALLQQLERQDGDVNDKASSKRDIEAIGKTVNSIATLHGEMLSCQKSIGELGARLEKAGTSRGLKSINEERDSVNEEEQSIQTKLKKIRSEKEKTEKAVNSLEREVWNVQRDLASADHDLANKAAKGRQIEELKEVNLAQKAVIHECEQKLDLSKAELEQAQEQLEDAHVRLSEQEQQLHLDAKKVNESLNELTRTNQDIQAYLDRDGPAKLVRAKAAVIRIEKEIKRLSEEREEVLKAVQKIDDRLRDHDKTRSNIDRNLRHRKETRALEDVQREIIELEGHDAEADKNRYWEEYELYDGIHKGLSMEQASSLRAVQEKDETLQKYLKDYEKDYKDSALKYRTAHINVETSKACIDDLTRYAGALDKAIMKFHSIKMSEINRTIDELWRKTYQGTDVDTIYIKSDAEASNNKSYNYRVCMLKQSTEMDMRGRCSAGQKVLACIIIRLALAECFGVNCGLIALDEPTTNLDRENIQALATALAELIKIRRAQKNFQLIIITHDEEFLKHMSPSDYVDYYYRISRNSKQKSQIKQEQISYLMRY